MKQLSIYGACLFLLLAAPAGNAQIMNDLGMMGGSGLVLTPTTAVTPESHFRLDVTRVSYFSAGAGSLNSYGMTNGLSPNMEITAKFQTAQSGDALAPSFIGLGAKLVL